MNKPLVLLLLAGCLALPARTSAQYVYIPEDIHFQAPHVPDFIEFAGQTIRIAFRHYDCFDEYTLIIDAVAVGTRK